MPSLRRTLSSPTVRSSPYSHSHASCPSSTTLSTRAGSRGPRRSTGSDTSERRVLADLDWWRVEASQREVRSLTQYEPLRTATPSSDEEELDQEERAPSPSRATVPSPTNVARALTPPAYDLPGAGTDLLEEARSFFLDFALADAVLSEPPEAPSPLTQFATLSISSQGRSTFRRSASISSTFSDSSFTSESSYSAPSFAPSFPRTGLGLDFSDIVSSPSSDDSDDDVPLPRLSRPASARPTPTRRSVSYSAFEDESLYTGYPFGQAFHAVSSPFLSNADSDDWFN